MNQTYPHFEIIVCDDGSTDESCQVVERYAQQDARVKLIRKSNGGVSSALNAAFAEARGDLIALLDADDAWTPKRLESVVRKMQMAPEAGTAGHHLEVIDQNGKIVPRRTPVRNLCEGWLGPRLLAGEWPFLASASAMTFRREIADRIFPLPLTLRAMADGALNFRAALLAPVTAAQEVLGYYRIHGQNISGAIQYLTLEGIDAWLRQFEPLRETIETFAVELLKVSPAEVHFGNRIRNPMLLSKAFLGREHLSWKQIKELAGDPRRQFLWLTLFALPFPVAVRLYTLRRTM